MGFSRLENWGHVHRNRYPLVFTLLAYLRLSFYELRYLVFATRRVFVSECGKISRINAAKKSKKVNV